MEPGEVVIERTSARAEQDAELRRLRTEIEALGLARPKLRGYALRAGWVCAATIAGYWLLLESPGFPARLLICAALGFTMVQSAAIAHEAGHGALGPSPRRILGAGHLFMSFLMGTSFASWQHRHLRHHAAPNTSKDPDVSLDLLPLRTASVAGTKGLRLFIARNVHILVWPIASLMGLAFKARGCVFVLRHPRTTRIDQICVALHFAMWLILPALVIGLPAALANYLMLTWFSGIHLAAIFMVNHVGTVADLGRSRSSNLLRQAAASRNIRRSSWLVTSVFNGLDSHIEHHLFPRIPYNRLHLARPATRAACERVGIPYHEVPLLEAYREFYRHCKTISQLARGEGRTS